MARDRYQYCFSTWLANPSAYPYLASYSRLLTTVDILARIMLFN